MNSLVFQKTDPHGDPIPDSSGKLSMKQQVSLLDVPLNVSVEVSNISDQSIEMLELLKHKSIAIGTKLEIRKKFAFDNSIELKIKSQPAITISEHVAKNVFVII